MTWCKVDTTPYMAWIHPRPIIALNADLHSTIKKLIGRVRSAACTVSWTTPLGITLELSKATSEDTEGLISLTSNPIF